MTCKVIVQGTGFVGKMVICELAAHPDFEIVGCIVNNPAKHGRDAGEIAGIGPIGVLATTERALSFMNRVMPLFPAIHEFVSA
jgi:4-hydroxy-tetrahydrodipicolinate reductase